MQRRHWFAAVLRYCRNFALLVFIQNIIAFVFGLGSESGQQNVPEPPPESVTKPAKSPKNPGLTFLRGSGFVVVCGDPDESMLFVDLNEAAKHLRRIGGTTVVTTTLGVVRIEAETAMQAEALAGAIAAYPGQKRFRWMPDATATAGMETLDMFWKDAT